MQQWEEYLRQQAGCLSSKHGLSSPDSLTEVSTGGATMGEFVRKVLFYMENNIWRAKLVVETPLLDSISSLSYGHFWYHSVNILCLSSVALFPFLSHFFSFPFMCLLGEGVLLICSSAVLGLTALLSLLMLENSNSGKCFLQVISDSNSCLFSVHKETRGFDLGVPSAYLHSESKSVPEILSSSKQP